MNLFLKQKQDLILFLEFISQYWNQFFSCISTFEWVLVLVLVLVDYGRARSKTVRWCSPDATSLSILIACHTYLYLAHAHNILKYCLSTVPCDPRVDRETSHLYFQFFNWKYRYELVLISYEYDVRTVPRSTFWYFLSINCTLQLYSKLEEKLVPVVINSFIVTHHTTDSNSGTRIKPTECPSFFGSKSSKLALSNSYHKKRAL